MLKKQTEVEGITEYRLDNGLKVLFFPDYSKETVTVNITYLVGSRHEGYGEAGMAHLLEHMLFKGTPTFNDIPKELKDRGAQMNGTTSFDRTNYFETLAASDENLDFALHLEADRMVNSFISEDDLQSEMSVVRSEFQRGENNPIQVLMQHMMSSCYRWHNYGKTTIGNLSDILNVPASRLKRFYKKHYRPENAVLVVAGNFKEESAKQKIETHFGSLPNPDQKSEETYTDEPAQQGCREVTVRRVGDVGFAATAFHIPAGSDLQFAAVDVLVGILSDQPAGRFFKDLVETKIASNAFSYAFSLHDPGVILNAAMIPADGDLEKAETQLMASIVGLTENPVTQQEVDRIKSQMAKQWEDHFADSQQAAISLSEWAALGDWRLMFLHRDRVEAVTADDVMKVASTYLVRENCTIGRFIPSPENLGVQINRPESIKDMVEGYQGRGAMASGEAFDPNYENIIKRTQLESASGIEMAFLPKKTRGQTVDLRLSIGYGNPGSLKNYHVESNLLPMLMVRGCKGYSFQQIDDLLTELKADLSITGSPGKLLVRLTAKRDSIGKVLCLVETLLREPTFPEDQFEILASQNITRLETKLSDPGSLAANRVTKILSPYPNDDIRFTPELPDQIKQIKASTIDNIQNLFRTQLCGNNAVASVVGDFEIGEVKDRLTKIVANWTSQDGFQRVLSKNFSIDGRLEIVDVPGKENAVFYGAQRHNLKSVDPDFLALSIGNHLIGGGGLSSRLAKHVRQEKGLSYSVGSSVRASNFQGYGTSSFYAICNPDDGQKLMAAVENVFDEVCQQGLTEEEVEQGKVSYLENAVRSRNDDSVIARILMESLESEIGLEDYRERELVIEGLNRDSVQKAIESHFQFSNFVSVYAGDSKKLGSL